MPDDAPPPLVVTPGEPAGVGAEITLRAWQSGDAPLFFLIEQPDRVRRRGALAGIDVACVAIDHPEEAVGAFRHGVPVLPCGFPVDCPPGRPDPANAGAVTGAIERAVRAARDGDALALVTNPIQKHTLRSAGFPHPGHTEFLAALAGGDLRPVMMLACDRLRVVPATIHEPLARVPALLSVDLIAETGRIVLDSLRTDFGIDAPRLAVSGLNPHAGEAGEIGREDAEIVAPAIAMLRAEGNDVAGPLPADSMFHAEARARYDAALCMYHDQALIPVKTLDFWGAVNATLGLPFVRTSPDHGTALNLAGTGRARPDSLIRAMHLAADMGRRRERRRRERQRRDRRCGTR